MSKLTDAACRAAKYDGKPLKLRDGTGLFLHVLPSGKYWRFDFRYQGKRRTLSLGVFPGVRLAQARIDLFAAKAQLADGIDPSYAKQLKKLVGDDESFGAITQQWLKRQDWSARHRTTVRLRLEKDVLPKLGRMSVKRIGPPDILGVLRAIESRGAVETAHRAKVVIGQIMRYAIGLGLVETDPTRDMRGVLATSRVRPRPAITDPESFGKLLRAIDTYDQSIIVAHAVRLAPYMALRPGELRQGEWAEIDFDGGMWRIPAERMKGGRDHFVPLAESATAILRSLREYTGEGGLMFPSLRAKGRAISDGTINAALKYLGYSGQTHTPHGFRSTFSTMAYESGRFDEDVIELQLAHQGKDRVKAAYNRAQHAERRRELMDWWAGRIDTMRRARD